MTQPRDDYLERHKVYRDRDRLRVAITGSSGMLGSALTSFLHLGEHEVVSVMRKPPSEGVHGIYWRPSEGEIDAASLEGFDVVVHLAGAGIADGRWTAKRKRLIYDSRVLGTRLLSKTLANLQRPPKVLLSSSGATYYGHTKGDVKLTENSPPGEGFLVDVCKAWEAETQPAKDAGIRVVNMRTGPVLSVTGGMLGRLLLPFRLGLGGRIGSGEQGISWISIDDMVAAMLYLMYHDEISGPVNMTAPNPVPNVEFTSTLGKVLNRPTIIPLPAFAIKLAFGEMGEVALLGGNYVLPQRLLDYGFKFYHPELEDALRHEIQYKEHARKS